MKRIRDGQKREAIWSEKRSHMVREPAGQKRKQDEAIEVPSPSKERRRRARRRRMHKAPAPEFRYVGSQAIDYGKALGEEFRLPTLPSMRQSFESQALCGRKKCIKKTADWTEKCEWKQCLYCRECIGPHPTTLPLTSLFAAVFTRLEAVGRRSTIRPMWSRIARTTGNVSYRFVVCGGGAPTSGKTRRLADKPSGVAGASMSDMTELQKAELSTEQKNYSDVQYLDCAEGYGSGALTRKVLASMQYFLDNHPNDYFMKIDDDTFIAWSRFAWHLQRRGSPNLYMGIMIEDARPCRNESFKWYEPYSTFANATFPSAMSGGAGYTIGYTLVEKIVQDGIGNGNILFNEDRAVGVWINITQRLGANVKFVQVRGIDGFWAWNWEKPTASFSVLGVYPYLVHHGLGSDTIACLAVADEAQDQMYNIQDCYKHEEGKYYEKMQGCHLEDESIRNRMMSRMASKQRTTIRSSGFTTTTTTIRSSGLISSLFR